MKFRLKALELSHIILADKTSQRNYKHMDSGLTNHRYESSHRCKHIEVSCIQFGRCTKRHYVIDPRADRDFLSNIFGYFQQICIIDF